MRALDQASDQLVLEIEQKQEDEGGAAFGHSASRHVIAGPVKLKPAIEARMIHERFMDVPEVVKLVAAINQYGSVKFSEFQQSGNTHARNR